MYVDAPVQIVLYGATKKRVEDRDSGLNYCIAKQEELQQYFDFL